MMKNLLAFIVLFGMTALSHATQHAFLMQNSGWMEPFYQDSNSQFKPLVNAVIQVVATDNDRIVVSTFNQSNALAESPEVIYQGNNAKQAFDEIKKQQIAYKNDRVYADTDFTEAVFSTITKAFSQKSGIIWIFTNNKNSPNNDAETTQRNKEFYTLIHDNAAINKVLAFPIKMPVSGQHFSASGLMIYALAYGKSAEQDLNNLVGSGRLAKVFTQQAALLKPLDKEPISLIPHKVENSSTITASLSEDKESIIFDLPAKKEVPEIRLKAALKNNFYPYNIAATKVDARLILANGKQAPININQKQINLLTHENAKFDLNLPIPADVVVSPWSWTAFKAMGKRVTIPAQVKVTLYEQKLTLSEQFKDSLQSLFPNDPLSDVFVAPDNIPSSTAVIPIQFRVQYPLYSVVTMMAGGIFLLLLSIFLIPLFFKAKKYDVLVNGKKQIVQLKPFSKQSIYDEDGKKVVAVVKRGLSQPVLDILDKNLVIKIR